MKISRDKKEFHCWLVTMISLAKYDLHGHYHFEDVSFSNRILVFFYFLSVFHSGSNHNNVDPQFYVQHLIRKLGNEAFIGQRAILSVSQRVSLLAESLLVTDPFDVSFPRMNQCMFTM